MALHELLASGADRRAPMGEALPAMLRAIRTHLGMDVAFVSEFAGGRRVFRYVDSEMLDNPVHPGASDPLEESYCARIVDGRLPALIHDAQQLPAAAALPVTRALPVGAHLSVPLRLTDGALYGTFCCFSTRPDHSLNERDVAMIRVFAELAAGYIDRDAAEARRHEEVTARIRAVLSGDGLTSVYQPIHDLRQRRVCGFEALSRFPATPRQGPDVWFAEAASVGLGMELELKALERALPALHALPAGAYLSLNVSPSMRLESLNALLAGWPKPRIVLEITEHEIVKEYETLTQTLRPVRDLGLRVAVDDAGAGYASFRHILRLEPAFIKLDMSLTRGIDADPARRALAAALIRFAAETRAELIAEGVETQAELDTLDALGVTKAQGYYLGKPMPLAEATAVAVAAAAYSRSRARTSAARS
jgi:EAL domain-containing protein (putative c-di-GMP-specific phosphodiesterase class I)